MDVKKVHKKYFLGIDMGTNSVGYAVTDENYNLIKKGNKKIWGVRLLEESKTANERRVFRANRRRIERRKERIKLLQTLFAEEIAKIDESFFIRLKESKYHTEDKGYKYTLFNDEIFNDKEYYKKYKTISHLKKDLIESVEKFDIRLIYLAVHNIVKNRGHFLFENLNDTKPSFEYVFDKLNIYISNKFGFDFSNIDYYELEEIIKNNSIGQKEKEKILIDFFNINKKEDIQKYQLLLALSNGKFDLCKLFDDETLKGDDDKSITLKLSEINDETFNKFSFSDEEQEIIVLLKNIYDWSILENILKGDDYISISKVNMYEQHKKDLAIFKKFIKENFDDEEYNKMFKESAKKDSKKDMTYANYVGINKKGNKKIYTKKCSKEDFYETIKTLLKKTENKESEEYLYINEKVENGTFLPKQVNKDNGIIPYQINLYELKKILENASKHYPFLLEKDKEDLTVIDKIISIFKFKIPYYVGPLNSHSPFSWFVKNSDEKIYPWNFKKVVNIEESGEKFIIKMTNKCSYLPLEDVLPKNSLLYSEYMVLNEINNLKINGVEIPVEVKEEIFNELFCKFLKVTRKRLENFLISKNYMEKEDSLSGIDIDIKSSMSSYINYKWLIDKHNNLDMIENIIKYTVIFGDDKKILKSKITKKYGDKLDEEDIKKCCSFKYSGWGRLSKKLLTEIKGINKETGEELSIIDMLRKTNNNLMEILSNRYNFMEKIKEENSLLPKEKSLLKIVDELYVSPSVKRPIYQTLLIIKEINKAMGYPPEKIFIETAREKMEEKNRTKKRKDKLEELYKSVKAEYPEICNQLKNEDDKNLDKIKLYLYYLQLGKCMYSGEPISLDKLSDANLYDRDHIYPRSKIKDDSFDNLVLVNRNLNADKTNKFPISSEIQERMKSFWLSLKEKGLLTEEKFKRLTRKTPLSEDELNVFIQRQLVETRQATKALGEILQEIYPNSKTKIVYVKAKLVSEFRQKYDLIKCREVNDYHHAKDAYLNIVAGNVYNTKFTEKYFIKRLSEGKESLDKMFEYDVENAWDKDSSLKIVKDTMAKNNVLFTRYSDTKRGGLFNQTLMPAGKNQDLLPIKKGLDTNKYGGYDSKSVSYYVIVEHTKKRKKIRSIESVYMYNRTEYEKSPEKYCEEILKLDTPKILLKKVKINTLFSLDGLHLHLSGKTGDNLIFKPAMQLILSYEEEKYIKKIVNCVEKGEKYFDKNENYILKSIGISKDKNIELYNTLINKLTNKKLKIAFGTNPYKHMTNNKDKFEESLTLYEQCQTLSEILKTLHCNSTLGSLKILSGKDNKSKIIESKKFISNRKFESIKIIYQSITGLYEQEIDLLSNDFKPKKRR